MTDSTRILEVILTVLNDSLVGAEGKERIAKNGLEFLALLIEWMVMSPVTRHDKRGRASK